MEACPALLLQHSLTPTRLLYSQSSVHVYEALHSLHNYTCVVKVQTVQNGLDEARKEAEAMGRLQHGNIVRLYESFCEQAGRDVYWGLVMEKCEIDLMKEIENRGRNGFPWSEEEVWYYVRCLVDAYAYMQSQALAHRDIKPHNIFLTTSKVPKVGDLGSSKSVFYVNQQNLTVAGTPLYLSPLLRMGLTSHIERVQHNVYKSDVYSLGLTFLHMMKLSPPIEVMVGDPQMREARIGQAIAQLSYSQNLQYLLRCMLAESEEARPTFVEIWNWLNPAPEFPQVVEEQRAEETPAIYGVAPRVDEGWTVQANPNAPGNELTAIAQYEAAQPGYAAENWGPQPAVASDSRAQAASEPPQRPVQPPSSQPAHPPSSSAVVVPDPHAVQSSQPAPTSAKPPKSDTPKDRCCYDCSLF